MGRVSTDDQLQIGVGDDQDELIGAGPGHAPPSRWAPGRVWAVAVVAVVVLAAGALWRGFMTETHVPLAVPPQAAAATGRAVESAGVPVVWRSGHPWVAVADAVRATDIASAALAPARPGRAAPTPAADDGLFLSAEAARSKRLGATMSAIEQMIESHAGVSRAQVMLAEAARPGAPGSAYAGPSAAATVTMTEGEMSQNLVDAVAALVSGSLPGLAPERVVVIDANANRRRSPRSTEERAAADARAEQAAMLAERLRAAVPPGSDIRVSVAPDRATHAVVVLAREHAQRVLEADTALPADIALATEEARVLMLAESLLPHSDGGTPATVVVTHDMPTAASVREERTPPVEATGDPIAAAMERELTTPLGAGAPAVGAWNASTLVLMALAVAAVGGALVLARRRAVPAPLPALSGWNDEGAPSREVHAQRGGEFPDAGDSSDAVRADTENAAAVVRAWLDAGYEARAAHLVVALDSGAAGALLRAMPPNAVRRMTDALGSLHTPTAGELRSACDSLVEELDMLRDPAHEMRSAAEQPATNTRGRR